MLFPIFISSNSTAQSVSNYDEGSNLGETRITINSEVIRASDLIISGNLVEYFLAGSEESVQRNLDQITKIEKATEEVKTERDGAFMVETTTYQLWPMYLTTLAGGLIGQIIGTNRYKWETIYQNDTRITNVSVSPEVWGFPANRNGFNISEVTVGMTLKLGF